VTPFSSVQKIDLFLQPLFKVTLQIIQSSMFMIDTIRNMRIHLNDMTVIVQDGDL